MDKPLAETNLYCFSLNKSECWMLLLMWWYHISTMSFVHLFKSAVPTQFSATYGLFNSQQVHGSTEKTFANLYHGWYCLFLNYPFFSMGIFEFEIHLLTLVPNKVLVNCWRLSYIYWNLEKNLCSACLQNQSATKWVWSQENLMYVRTKIISIIMLLYMWL